MALTFEDLIEGRSPPWKWEADQAAARGDEEAARKLERYKSADKARGCVVAAFSGSAVEARAYRQLTEKEKEKIRKRALKAGKDWESAIENAPDRIQVGRMSHRGALIEVGGRFMRADQPPDPVRTAKKIAGCCSGWGVHEHRETGIRTPHGLGCDDPACPLCGEDKATARDRKIGPVLVEFAEAGHRLIHLTITLPQLGERPRWWDHGRPCYLTIHERRRGIWAAPMEAAEVGVMPAAAETRKAMVPDLPGAQLDPLPKDSPADHLAHLPAWSPTPGEGLADNQGRLDRAMRQLKKSTKKLSNGEQIRDFWRRFAVGLYRGYEHSGFKFLPLPHWRAAYGKEADLAGTIPIKRDFKGRKEVEGVLIPRWHGHCHAVLILGKDADVIEETDEPKEGSDREPSTWLSGPDWALFCEAWRHAAQVEDHLTGDLRQPDDQAQRARVIDTSDPEKVRDAVREVVKYAFKPAELTDAQRLECLAVLKGRTMHSPGGVLHTSSTVGKAARALRAAELGAEVSELDAEALEALQDDDDDGERLILAQTLCAGWRRVDEEMPPPPLILYCRPLTKSEPVEFGDRIVNVAGIDEADKTPRRLVDEEGRDWIPLLVRHLAREVSDSIDRGDPSGFIGISIRKWDPVDKGWTGPPDLLDGGALLAELLAGPSPPDD